MNKKGIEKEILLLGILALIIFLVLLIWIGGPLAKQMNTALSTFFSRIFG